LTCVDFAPPITQLTCGGNESAAYFVFKRRNEMLGLGLVGTIIVIVVIVWIIRRV
jgi:hypothetical protein